MSQLAGTVAASFQYDPFGRRVSKTISGNQTGFVYDGMSFVQEKSGSTVTAKLLTGLGIDETFSRTQASATSSVLADALGSTIALTDGTGAISTSYTFEPYGNTTQSGSANANSQQFTGRENDLTGLYYNRARYYSPVYGRFLSEDPIGIGGGPNGYAYAGGDPISSSDALGLFSMFVHNHMTYDAAIAEGLSPAEAHLWAIGVVNQDFNPNFKEAQSTANGPNHDMCPPYMTPVDCAKEVARLIASWTSGCDPADWYKAMHDTQDTHAWGHGGKTWDGDNHMWPGFRHMWTDVFPSRSRYNDALSDTRKLFKRWKIQCGCNR